MSATTHHYGDEASQFCEVWMPREAPPPAGWPLVVLLHGGFWKAAYDLSLMNELASDLAQRGCAVANVEYRRVEPHGRPAWPGTGDDVIAGIEHARSIDGVDGRRVAIVGHSAGGHLALWAALSGRLAHPPLLALGQAPIADLARCAVNGVGNGDIDRFIGGEPDVVPQRYAAASPAALVPSAVPQLIVHGTADEDVPFTETEAYVLSVEASSSPITLLSFPGVGHMELIDAGHESWEASARAIDGALRPNVALTGFMATGKTSVGRFVADELGYEFVDVDQLIAAEHGPIPTIFADHGEAAFRELEQTAIEQLSTRTGLVIATGGGLVTHPASADALDAAATVVTLEASATTIAERVEADGATRPLLEGAQSRIERIEALLDERSAVYGRYPSIDAERPASEVATAVTAAVFG